MKKIILIMLTHKRDAHLGEQYDDIFVLEPSFELQEVLQQGNLVKDYLNEKIEEWKKDDPDVVVDVKLDVMPQHEVMVVSTQGEINNREKREVIQLPTKYNMLERGEIGKRVGLMKRKGDRDAEED